MRISLKNWEIACRLQAETPVADLHMDLPGELLFRRRRGQRHVIAGRYLPLWRKAGISLIGAAVYVEDENLPEGVLRSVLLQIEALKEEIEEAEGAVHLIRKQADLEPAYDKSSVGLLLYLEGLDCIGTDTGLLSLLSELGVRGASLVWSRQNLLACGCCRAYDKRDIRGRLTEAGIDAVHKMKELHMFLDISHLNDEGAEEVLTGADIPVLATHSNAREVYFHYRNLTRGQIDLLSDRGGIIGLNACSLLTGSARDGRHLELLQKHGRYLADQAGADHVALGLDLCRNYELARRELPANQFRGTDALPDQGELGLLTAALLEAGISPQTMKKILGENVFAFLRRVLPQ